MVPVMTRRLAGPNGKTHGCPNGTNAPTEASTEAPTDAPTIAPTAGPTADPTAGPTANSTLSPTTVSPTKNPIVFLTTAATPTPTIIEDAVTKPSIVIKGMDDDDDLVFPCVCEE